MPQLTKQQQSAIAVEFVEWLRTNHLIRTWHRPDLAEQYKNFCNERLQTGRNTINFSKVLFLSSRRRELAVRGGQTVVFRGTDDFRRRSFPTLRKIESKYVKIRPLGDRCEERRTGWIRRRFSDMSTSYSWIELEVQNVHDSCVTIKDCTVLTRRPFYRVKFQPGQVLLQKEKVTILIHALEEGEVRSTEIEILCEVNLSGRVVQDRLIRYLKYEVSHDNEVESSEDEDDAADHNSKHGGYVSFAGFIEGEKPDTLYENNLKMEWKLEANLLPKDIREIIKSGALNSRDSNPTKPAEVMKELLEDSLTTSNYVNKFKALLQLEEFQNQEDIKRYDMKSATLHSKANLLYLYVPGLAEKRPSVLQGDKVYVKPLTSDGQFEHSSYQGYVHRVEQEQVGLGFNYRLKNSHVRNKQYYVRFDFNRLALKLMHRATSAMQSRSDSDDILFPSSSIFGISPPDNSLKVCNRLIEDNPQQKRAVEAIAGRNASKVFIIYGPPGTGKTITMVEAIHQVLRKDKQTHMLVCAPSNSACDLLASRLLKHVDTREIVRMNAASRNWNEIPTDVKEVSNYDNWKFCFPAKQELMKARIIVTTLITAGRIASAKFPKDHFDYVFIDEAGQAMEPEIMISVAGVLSETKGKIVLAGDPKQLGPVIRSSIAAKKGLQLSFLERLMTTSPKYMKTENTMFDSQSVVKLLKNYRSHEAIIHVSNNDFYDNELEVCADEIQRNYLSSWEQLPSKGFPLIFHGVQGEDKQESTSPSFFNPQEVKRVKKYVDMILDIRGRKVKPEEIGVITPYRKQVQKLRKELNNSDIKVGSVEEFQGQERRVIVISTVRSNTSHLRHDARFNLGFLRNPKRFNVAVTRAKALMIIIGNPKVLCLDQYWKSLLDYCLENGGYQGISFNRTDMEMSINSLEEHFNDLVIGDREKDNLETIDDQANPQWRQDP